MRAIALIAVLVVIAAACSKPKKEANQLGGTKKGESALTQTSAAPGTTNKPGQATSVSVNGPAAKGYGALNPGADTKQAAHVGSLIKLQSTSYSNPNTYLGVTKDTIKLNFAIDKTNCPPNTFALLSNAAANAAKETRFYRKASFDQDTINKEIAEGIKDTVDYWNIHVGDVAADVPQAVQVMKKYNTPGHLFYGRRLSYDVIDAGSFQCPTKQDAAATQMRDSTHPFSAVVYDVPGLYENGLGLAKAMAAKMPSKRPMLFGMLDTSDKFLTQYAPYVWGEFQSITKQSRLAAGWICSDLKGTGPGAKNWGNGLAVNAVDTAYKKMKRNFGLIYTDSVNSIQAANELKDFLKSGCGITFNSNTEFRTSDNPARGASEGSQIAAKFKGNGVTVKPVTTVIYLIDFLGAFFHIIDFKNAGYKPEYAEIGTGWDTNTVQRLSPDQDMVDKASMFYTQFGVQGFGFGPGDPFWVYHATHQVYPGDHKACDPRTEKGMNHTGSDGSPAALYCKAPGAIVAWYYSWLPLIGGLIFAGPNLTPSTVTAGLQAYPLTRYGVDGPTTDPVAVLVGAGPGQYYFITDGSSGRWRAGFVSPPPEQVLGFPDYPDCQRHYIAWPNSLAPQWEKNGPNYNAWCGNPKYTKGWSDQGKSVPYAPSAASGQKCSSSNPNDKTPPGGHCEADNYPRWEPVLYR